MHYTIDPAPPPWVRSFQDPRDAGPSSAHISDLVFQTQPEVLSVTFYSKHAAGVCQRRAKAAAAWAQAMFALLSPAPLHPPGNNDGISSHRATQHCTCHSPVAMEESHLGKGSFEGQSLNMQSTRAIGKSLACPWFLSLLPLSFQLEIWLETQAGAGQPRYFTDALCFFTKLYIWGNKNSP